MKQVLFKGQGDSFRSKFTRQICAEASMEKPARRRGRPPITKDYANPMESPMAHSSLKMQKQGAQGFSRPMMKVGSVTPSPRNRSSSNSGTESCSNPGSTTKKGRYRGVILSTPTKWPAGGNGSSVAGSATTPTPSSSDSVFCSASKMALKSSPPLSTSPLKNEEGSGKMDCSQFKFSLTIGENGRASIAGSSQGSTPVKPGSSDSEETGLPTFEKSKVLTLLKQMRSDPPAIALPGSMARIKKPLHKRKQNSFPEIELPPIFEAGKSPRGGPMFPQSPQPPSTPKTSFSVRTGFTPNVGIDQVLLDVVTSPRSGTVAGSESQLSYSYLSNMISLSPRSRLEIHSPHRQRMDAPQQNHQTQPRQSHHSHQHQQRQESEQQEQQDQLRKQQESPQDKQQSPQKQKQQQQQQQQQQQFVFKFSSADPLLLTDDADGNWSEIIYNHLQNSPRPQICFNTSPSWVNFGSPRAFSPQRRDSTTLAPTHIALESEPPKGRLPSQIHRADSVTNINSSPPRKELFPTLPLRNPSLPCSTALSPRVSSSHHAEKFVPEPSTPRSQEVQLPTMIECTPLIQQTMNGSLTTKYISGMLSAGGTMTDSIAGKEQGRHIPVAGEQEDARAALKRLIAER
ncbi:MSA2 (YKR077W) and MSA1 (YOR066W) [Zygosaccharomyces parabailii]|nr:MSA2 (YKR077W) and MSA1 (YOR066W) [Zygosaccharomyces parabailii]